MEYKEDQNAPFSRAHIELISRSNSFDLKNQVVHDIFRYLYEKRDSYNGVVSSIIYTVDSRDEELVMILQERLSDVLASSPTNFAGKVFLTRMLFRLTNERPEFVANFFRKFIGVISGQPHITTRDKLKLKIIALKAITQADEKVGKKLTDLSDDEVNLICDEALENCDDFTKVDTLILILDTKITTRILEKRELDIYLSTFQEALSFQEPSLRQMFLAITNKTVKRISSSHRVVVRDTQRFDDRLRQEITSRYMGFLETLINLCIDSIYCNAYFGSFILTMSTLKHIIENISFENQDLPISQYFKTKTCYDSILSCLNDSFEENKFLALELILLLPHNENVINAQNMERFEDIAYHLVGSVNPAHSLTCQYVFRLMIGLQCRISKASNGDPESSRLLANQIVYNHLEKLVHLVENGVRETRDNFIIAFKNNAIYPKLTCIRALLDEVDLESLRHEREKWEKLVGRVVSALIESCQAVSTVVCNLNPETIGHLPMDLKPLDIEALAKNLNISIKITDDQLQTITSQMLLISGWKTIKECSLSMGTLCLRFWWPSQRIRAKLEKYPGFDFQPILDPTQVIKIIEFFDHYLRNLRHRGAFEQAYNGFLMVSKRVWHDEKLRNLLINTLNDIMDDFRGKRVEVNERKVQYLKAYVTRRSAGLPFIVQAIVSSEHRQESKTLCWIMDSLFEVLENGRPEIYQRIHCLNILRALIKEHQLREKVLPFAGRALAITMDSFNSESFPIRNCANMLLKAVVDRIFGVNRLRDDIHKRNKLSFEKFFSEFPYLHSKMLAQLVGGLGQKESLASVHAVFVVLSRLKPSLNPSDEYNHEKMILPFIEPTKRLALVCPDYKLRELSAKLTVQFENHCRVKETHEQYIGGKIDELIGWVKSADLDNDLNRLHGCLLMVMNWVETGLRTSDTNLVHDDRTTLAIQTLVRDILLSNLEGRPIRNASAFGWKALQIVALDIVQIYCLHQKGKKFSWLQALDSVFSGIRDELENQSASQAHPFREQYNFKIITTGLTLFASTVSQFGTDLSLDESQQEWYLSRLDYLWRTLLSMIFTGGNSTVNLKAALVRYLNHFVSGKLNVFLQKLHTNMDMDLLANFITPFDNLELSSGNDLEHALWLDYCNIEPLFEFIATKECSKNLFNFEYPRLFEFSEFKPLDSSSTKATRFSARLSNTPLGVEILSLAYNWTDLLICRDERIKKSVNWSIDFISEHNLIDLIESLPDCDTKSFALMLCARLVNIHMKRDKAKTYPKFTAILEELSSGNHSYVIRETCVEVLKIILPEITCLDNRKEQRTSFLSSMSALIKLSQDEENEIRQKCRQVVSELLAQDGPVSSDSSSGIQHERLGPLQSCGRADNLVKLITERLFRPSEDLDVLDCLHLSLRIIFDHSKDCSIDMNEEREQLFDKSKLNTFADHVATIQSVLVNVESLMNRGEKSEKPHIEWIRISDEIRHELLHRIDRSHLQETSESSGDYSWRHKLSSQTSIMERSGNDCDGKSSGNEALVEKTLEAIISSLDYFSCKYWNMLTDTEYPFNELALFKRIAFIRFMTSFTNYRPKNITLLQRISDELQKIVETSCSTTMLCKCVELLRPGVAIVVDSQRAINVSLGSE